MSIISICRICGFYYLANVDNEYMSVYGLYYLTNVNNKYMHNMASIIWLMSIISDEEYGLYYLQMLTIHICSILLVLSG